LNLSDLNVESELIPFFDMSLNRHSREALTSIFNTLPKTTAEALDRKQVLAGFTANLDRIKNLVSYKADIEEAYEFCFSNSFFLLSTHFYKLKELHVDEMNHAAFYYVDSSLEDGVPKFTYEVKEGWSDIKFGSILFEREGLIQLLK